MDPKKNPEQSAKILDIKTQDEQGKTIGLKEIEKKVEMAEAAEKVKKEASDIILDIYDILEKTTEKPEKGFKIGGFLFKPVSKLDELLVKLTQIKLSEKVAFFQLLAVMINAGIPLVKSLAVLADQMQNVRFKRIIAEMTKMVDKGYSLSDALAHYPALFTEAQIGMVEAAEASGQLNEVLRSLALEMEKKARITARVKGAMTYPAVILLILILVGVLMMILVVPKIVVLFTDSSIDLPLPTKLLIFMSNAVLKYWGWSLLALVVLVLSVRFLLKTDRGKYYFDVMKINLPILGILNKKLYLSRFTRGLANLLHSGIPIVKALIIDANSIGNIVYRDRVLVAAEDVKSGIPLGENLSGSKKLFPTMVSHMIYVGEQTAQLDVICNKIADFYDEEVDIAIASLARIMEPLILILVGAGVGFMVAAIMMPMMQLIDVTSVL